VSPIRPENRGRYPADWPAIRETILERASERGPGSLEGLRFPPRCECVGECGRGTHTGRCPNVHGHEAYGTGSTVVLTIAHLDHVPEHSDPSNLKAMCQGCHLHYDREHHAETRAATRRAELEAAGQDTLPL
jgi:5-methylcytosine-specific restriction endonuclease McrA